jgi:septum formation protein
MSIGRLYMTQLILASTSSRRQEILKKANIPFVILPPDMNEEAYDKSNPKSMVCELAKNKALSVLNKVNDDDIVLGVDTIVYIDNVVLGKPANRADAKKMMQMLSGRKHSVISGVCLIGKNGFIKNFHVETEVVFNKLDENEIEDYINTDEPYDKAGGYAIQGLASKFISGINGCYYNVMGLPLSEIYSVIKNII